MRFLSLVPFAMIFFVALISCRSIETQSDLQLTNSRKDTTGLFKPVFQLAGEIPGKDTSNACTATAVSPNTALTAGHCVKVDGQVLSNLRIVDGEDDLVGLKPKATNGVLLHPNFEATNTSVKNDLAVLIFDGEPFQDAFVSLTNQPATVGDRITIIGYGKKDHDDEKSIGGRHFGVNDIATVPGSTNRNTLSFYGHPRYVGQSEDGKAVYVDYTSTDDHTAAGKKVGASQGDSGGPMLLGGLLVGVASSIDQELSRDGMIHAHYEYVLGDSAKSFLQSATRYQASISGLHGNPREKRKLVTPTDLEEAILDNTAINPNENYRGGGARELLNTECRCTVTTEECRLDVVDKDGRRVMDLASDDPSACSSSCKENFAGQYTQICRKIIEEPRS